MRWTDSTLAVGAVVSFFVPLLVVVRILFFGGFAGLDRPPATVHPEETTAVTQEEEPWRRNSEYVLDRTWDVDAPPQKRYFNWTISEISGNPDGVARSLLAINSRFPGPLVRANENDALIIDVHNALSNSTSLHWHGQYQNGTNSMDGTFGVTNCAIPPKGSFRYEFNLTNTRGTYWYHAHYSTQRVDGLFGPLIVHSRTEEEEIAESYGSDVIVMVQDYYHDLSPALLPGYLAPDNENAEPIPKGALINGRNVFNCSLTSLSCTTDLSALTVFSLSSSGARFRFINTGAFAEFEISLDSHPLNLVEVDGVAVTSPPIDRFRLNVAQRYSFIIRNPSKSPSYYLRARMIPHCFAAIPEDLDLEVKAIVHYSMSQPPPTPTTTAITGEEGVRGKMCHDLNLTSVHPRTPHPPPREADMFLPLRSNFEIGAYRLSRAFINTTSWRPSHPPTLHRLATKAELDEHQLLIRIPRGKVVDILLDNYDDGNHPFHLHGYKFWVIGQGNSGYFHGNVTELNLENPVYRDTVTLEAFRWVVLRFVADNVGLWALHCHIAWHAEAGMLVQFLVGDDPGVEAGQGTVCQEPVGGMIADESFYW